ncbi:Alpha/Beta hydrolase protein [Suillus subaureus]|uniref:Alpha/Beta hydrolase protein n=1 Tax=Suillus subaureus TaxID=48587 RepID=A0A9P7EPW7_9AGAM|nr:Alpha/Beta hydrolase protein [Suillus subaureus]KAG1827060.1 Alpha/Beta hydrolase protein [Suillus subaureus]
MDEYTDISYIPSEPHDIFQNFNIYIPKLRNTSDGRPPLVCFIHGGAWRSEDKLDHVGLAHKLASFTGYAVAIPNYRLSPRETTEDNAIHHPNHAKDVLRFLEFVTTWGGPHGTSVYDSNRLCLMGHSCGAHILSSIFLEATQGEDPLRPSVELLESTKAIIMSEGIYDIDLLLSSFPTYRTWFIEPAFGRRSTYGEVSVTKMNPRVDHPHLHWLIVHSKGDTLVDEAQSEAMYQHLLPSVPHIARNFGDLIEEHNDILKASNLLNLLDNTF